MLMGIYGNSNSDGPHTSRSIKVPLRSFIVLFPLLYSNSLSSKHTPLLSCITLIKISLSRSDSVRLNSAMRRFFGRGSAQDSPPAGSSSPSSSSPFPPLSINTMAGPARPIRFVYCDEKGKFQIDPEALAVLQLVKEPVGVVAVCGRARQGKSYILNQVNVRKLEKCCFIFSL